MEQEYKWDMPKELEFADILRDEKIDQAITGQRHFSMKAIYYDTPDAMFSNMRGALRIREENLHSVCCMKLLTREVDGCKIRDEYEIAAKSVQEGLSRLPECGAPAQLCTRVLEKGVSELCRTEFTRDTFYLRLTDGVGCCEGELAFDRGYALRETSRVPFSEIEFEYKSGSIALFHGFATWLEQEHCLKRQPLSKMARALNA